jgi:hypothetical protein
MRFLEVPFIDSLDRSHSSLQWGPDQQDFLCKMAEDFKKSNDRVGLNLCNAADLEMKKCSEMGTCPAFGIFLLDIVIMSSC